MLTRSVASQRFQPIARGKAQILQTLRRINHGELPDGRDSQIPRHAGRQFASEHA